MPGASRAPLQMAGRSRPVPLPLLMLVSLLVLVSKLVLMSQLVLASLLVLVPALVPTPVLPLVRPLLP